MEILSGSLCHIQVPKPNIQIQNQACLCHFCKNANGGMTDVDSSSVFMSRVSRFRFDSVIFKMTSNELASILFVVAGGTIDKDYPRSTGGYAFEFGDEPAIERLLDRLSPSFDYEVVTAFQKDSLEVTDEDRQTLAQIIEGKPQSESME